MRADTIFDGDDLRRNDPQFINPRFAQYLAAVARLDRLAQCFGKHVIHLAVRWMLDQGIKTAFWGARHPDQLQSVDEVVGWSLDPSAKVEIDRIPRETITDPVGPEFMARRQAASQRDLTQVGLKICRAEQSLPDDCSRSPS